MKYFNNVTGLSDLKKQYRLLAIANHPDKGGSTEAMQDINAEFEKLYKIHSLNKESAKTNTGYENDYEGATAKEYTEHVYNEYNWKGERYKSNLHRSDLVEIFRNWLKETYPNCKFSVNRNGWSSITVHILKMDFNPFTAEIPLLSYDVNTYNADRDKNLNERARDIVSNIISYMNSYNYDNSDSMTDYFDRGFYVGLSFGNNRTPFVVEIPKSRRTGGVSDPEFIRPVGKAHSAIKKALGKAYFSLYQLRRGEMCVLGEDHVHETEATFYPLTYAGRKTAEKRVEKLAAAGMRCEIVGSYIVFLSYTEEVERELAAEDRAADAAEKEWNINKTEKNEPEKEKEEPSATIVHDGVAFEITDYSEKSIAVFGDTKQLKDQLKAIGGRFNKFLAYGDGKRAGWVFPKSKRAELETLFRPDQEEQNTPAKEETPERQPMNDGAYMAFVSCLQKRLLSVGYKAAREYAKDKVKRYTMRTDQLRYIAFLLSDFRQRCGTEIKSKAA